MPVVLPTPVPVPRAMVMRVPVFLVPPMLMIMVVMLMVVRMIGRMRTVIVPCHRSHYPSNCSKVSMPPSNQAVHRSTITQKRTGNRVPVTVLESQVAERGMIVGTAARWPMILAPGLGNRQIVDAGDAQSHEAVFVEFPVFIAETAKPLAAVVVPLVGEAYGDAILRVCPELLDKAIVEFTRPLAGQEPLNGIAALQYRRPVTPAAVLGIGT